MFILRNITGVIFLPNNKNLRYKLTNCHLKGNIKNKNGGFIKNCIIKQFKFRKDDEITGLKDVSYSTFSITKTKNKFLIRLLSDGNIFRW